MAPSELLRRKRPKYGLFLILAVAISLAALSQIHVAAAQAAKGDDYYQSCYDSAVANSGVSVTAQQKKIYDSFCTCMAKELGGDPLGALSQLGPITGNCTIQAFEPACLEDPTSAYMPSGANKKTYCKCYSRAFGDYMSKVLSGDTSAKEDYAGWAKTCAAGDGTSTTTTKPSNDGSKGNDSSDDGGFVTPTDSKKESSGLSTGALVGIIVGGVVLLALIIGIFIWSKKKKPNNHYNASNATPSPSLPTPPYVHIDDPNKPGNYGQQHAQGGGGAVGYSQQPMAGTAGGEYPKPPPGQAAAYGMAGQQPQYSHQAPPPPPGGLTHYQQHPQPQQQQPTSQPMAVQRSSGVVEMSPSAPPPSFHSGNGAAPSTQLGVNNYAQQGPAFHQGPTSATPQNIYAGVPMGQRGSEPGTYAATGGVAPPGIGSAAAMCTACGEELIEGALFCTRCGKPLNNHAGSRLPQNMPIAEAVPIEYGASSDMYGGGSGGGYRASATTATQSRAPTTRKQNFIDEYVERGGSRMSGSSAPPTDQERVEEVGL